MPNSDLSRLGLPYCVASVKGAILYDRRPISESTNARPIFWVSSRSEPRTPHTVPTVYDPATAEYEVPDLPPGDYTISVYVDSGEPFNGKRGFALDFRGVSGFKVSPQQVYRLNLSLRKVIHLTSPVDNQRAQRHTSDSKDAHTGGSLFFSWETIPEAVSYDVRFRLYKEPFTHVTDVHFEVVDTGSFEANLPINGDEEFYVFTLTAKNEEGELIAEMMTPYSNGYGWDYRFRMVEP